jgi:hypothetical protein
MSVFADSVQAQNAINDLQRAGFGPEQIRYSVYRSGVELTSSLERLGLTEQEASFYNREFEAGHTVVLVMADDRKSEAYDVLRRDGGYDYREEAHVERKDDVNMQEMGENTASEA